MQKGKKCQETPKVIQNAIKRADACMNSDDGNITRIIKCKKSGNENLIFNLLFCFYHFV